MVLMTNQTSAYKYEHLVTNVLNEEMKMCEVLQANIMLKKLPIS